MLAVAHQLEKLSAFEPAFSKREPIQPGLIPLSLKTLQINVGKRCNQACVHCHVDASPVRTESMSEEIALACLQVLKAHPEIETVDITGGAPEMNPHFRALVTGARSLGRNVIDRCNLTILEEPGHEDLYAFLKENEVEIVASLPHFSAASTNRQRGAGVFETSITALGKLNALGYGTTLPLSLVYNPNGYFLSASQEELEREFKHQLERQYGVRFNRLYCINNMPVSRFLESLLRRGRFDEYMDLLANAFNPATLDGLMCRHQISVGYDGYLYDCDFNQMLDLRLKDPIGHISRFNLGGLMERRIITHNHCFGCTAGAGSSCSGQIPEKQP
jgi:radical SAM/Cys-rich protein